MCDSLVALGNSTKDGSVIFGKNSDRPQSEAQIITHVPGKKQDEDYVKCTYISIPQVRKTKSVILSQPYWMWGAEMGANEYNVVIGNEAVYSHEKLRDTGLLGMDLLRLGLERSKSALEAVNVITQLLEKFHQGGGCSYNDSTWKYHNSFLVADLQEAYVLETADDWWIVEKVKTVRSISNGLSIRGMGDFRREGIIQHAIEKGYCKDDDQFDFALTFSGNALNDSPYSRGGKSKQLLTDNIKEITPSLMMQFLREHQVGICMHGGFESTGSQVSHLMNKDGSIHWFTGTTLPCLSVYKPYHFPVDNQITLKPGPYSSVNEDWAWKKYSNSINLYSNSNFKKKLQSVEKGLISKVKKIQENRNNKLRINHEINQQNKEIWEFINKVIN